MKLAAVAIVAFFLGSLTTHYFTDRVVLAQEASLNNGFMPQVPPLGTSVPRVFPLPHISVSNNLSASIGPVHQEWVVHLDGIDTEGNVFINPAGTTFIYGGGAYKMEGNSVGGPIKLVLTGAAANTAALLTQFGIIKPNPSDAFTIPAEKNTPIVHKKTIPKPLNGDMESQYDGVQQR